MTFRKVLMSSIASIAAVASADLAMAADVNASSTSAKADTGTAISEVIVTAQKRSENLQKVPVAITAFTSAQREVTGIITAQQQLDITPSVVFTSGAPFSTRVSIRGIGRTDDQLGTDNGVAYYTDGFYNPSPDVIGDSTLRQSRTEVLRGPQGTLYGRNSIGGAINVISRRPSDHFEAEARLNVNNWDGVKGEVRVSGPITDHVRVSVDSVIGEQSEGYFKNVCGSGAISPPDNCHPFTEGGNYNSADVDLQVSYDVNKAYDGWIRFYYGDTTTHPRTYAWVNPYIVSGAGGSGGDFPQYGGIGNNPASPSYLNPLSNPSLYNIHTLTEDTQPIQKTSPYIFLVGEQNFHLGWVDIKYTGGYLSYKTRGVVDGDSTARASYTYDAVTCVNPAFLGQTTAQLVNSLQTGTQPAIFGVSLGTVAGFFATPCSAGSQFGQETLYPASTFATNDDSESDQQELDFTSTSAGPLKWIGGLYYFHSNDIGRGNYVHWVNNPRILNLFNAADPADPIANPQEAQFISNTGLQVWSYAAFAQFDYDFTSTLHGSVGFRYTYDQKHANEAIFGGLDFPFAIHNDGTYVANGGGPVYLNTLNGIAQSYGTLALSGGPRNLQGHWDAPTGTASLQWTPSNETNAYIRYSRGYKSGGFNLGSVSPLPYVGSETLDDYEIGWKQQYDGKFRSNLAAFFYDYHNMQAQDFTAFGMTTLPALINIKEAQSYGVEEELDWNPTDALTLWLNYSYLHGRITKATPEVSLIDPTAILPGARPCGPPLPNGNQPQCLEGNKIPNSPPNKVSVGGVYTFHFEKAGDLSVSILTRWHDGSYYNPYNGINSYTPPSDLTDVSVKWDPNRHLTVIASSTNVFNQVAQTGQVLIPTSFALIRYFEPPRVTSLELQYRW
jgi:iron complex outermembrane receptor protein